MNENGHSYADYLYKKEAKGKWVHYWVILDGKYLKFYETNKCENLIGRVEIGNKSKCVVSNRKQYSFPFTLCAANGRYLLKCESAIRRHRWMKEIHQTAELLRLPLSAKDCAEEDDLRTSAFENKALDNIDDEANNEEILPPSVLLVTSLPSTCDSSSIPFKLQGRDRKTSDDSAEYENGKRSPRHKSIVYSFGRDSKQPVQKVSDLERKQFSSLHISSSFDSDLLSDSPYSPRARSFPTTPEKGVRPTSSPALHPSYFGKSQSLNSLNSRTDMRFSRHMVSGSDIGDTEV